MSRGRRLDRVPAGVALFLGLFSIVNVLGSLFWSGFDASVWWVDMRSLPAWLARVLLAICGVSLIAFGFRRPASFRARAGTVFCAGFLATLSLVNTVVFFILSFKGHIISPIPLPVSLLVAGFLAWIAILSMGAPKTPGRWQEGLGFTAAIAGLCAVAFPLAQMFLFGKTDYRRPAEVAIVLGARAYADGRPSDALADRVRTACELYREGNARKLLFSGGPGDGTVHETESMRNLAVKLGVPSQDIILDKGGLNTRATVRNTRALLDQMRASRVLVVSHFYHLPRLKLTYSRANREVYTVPARETYLLRQLPFNLAREVVALWVYYLRPSEPMM